MSTQAAAQLAPMHNPQITHAPHAYHHALFAPLPQIALAVRALTLTLLFLVSVPAQVGLILAAQFVKIVLPHV